jgi:hypothetical protein
MSSLKIGSLVKSLDFHSNRNCYYIGIVKSINADEGTFTAETVARYWEGVPLKAELPVNFTAPMEGNHFFDDPSRPRVINLDGVAA